MSDQKKNSQHMRFNKWLKASATVSKGDQRPNMEDRILISDFTYLGKRYYVFLLMDGHGGEGAVDLVKQEFQHTLVGFLIESRGMRVRSVIQKTFEYLDQLITYHELESGTTASLLLVIDNPKHIWLANIGDSSVCGIKIQGSAAQVRKLSLDHSVELKGERSRIEQDDDYEIDEDGYVCRGEHALAMTRALGDRHLGPLVLPTPTIRRIKVDYDMFVLASDGIWDVMSGRKLWDRIKSGRERRAWRESAWRVNEYRNGKYAQHDNTSLILVYLNQEKGSAVTRRAADGASAPARKSGASAPATGGRSAGTAAQSRSARRSNEAGSVG